MHLLRRRWRLIQSIAVYQLAGTVSIVNYLFAFTHCKNEHLFDNFEKKQANKYSPLISVVCMQRSLCYRLLPNSTNSHLTGFHFLKWHTLHFLSIEDALDSDLSNHWWNSGLHIRLCLFYSLILHVPVLPLMCSPFLHERLSVVVSGLFISCTNTISLIVSAVLVNCRLI